MSQAHHIWDASFIAESDLNSYRYHVVTYGTAAGTVKICGTSDVPVGVLQNAPAIGEGAVVRRLGSSKVMAAGGFAYGDNLAVADSVGRVDTVGAAPANIIGQAWEMAGKAGVIVEMVLSYEFVAASIAPAALTAACTGRQLLVAKAAGDILASVTATLLGVADTEGTVGVPVLQVANRGVDTTEALSLELDVLINGVSALTTKPKITKAADDGDSTAVAGAGITVGVVDAAKNILAAGDLITYTLTLVRTASPTTEIADAHVQVPILAKVGA